MRRRFGNSQGAIVNVITIDQTNRDPFTRVSGDINGDVIQYIRNNSHRVLAKKTAEGVVSYCRLDDTNSNKYYDGSPADLTGAEGDVFVKLPKFYYKGTEGNTVNIYFSRKKLDSDYIEWNGNIFIGAYECFIEQWSNYFVLRSVSNVLSTGKKTHDEFKVYATNRGVGFRLVDWQMHCVIGCLYYAMYGNTDCQKQIGNGSGSLTNGQTNNFGMKDTAIYSTANYSINFLGLENWWGGKYEFIDDCVTKEREMAIEVYDPANGGKRSISFGRYDGFYIKMMRFGRYLDLVNIDSNTSGYEDDYDGYLNTYYCDYQRWPSGASIGGSEEHSFQRSCSGGDYKGGVAFLDHNKLSYYEAYRSSRLAFRGTSNEILNVNEFKAIPIA